MSPTPARSLEQRRAALRRANAVRTTRKDAKALIAADESYQLIVDLIEWRSAPVGELYLYATMHLVDVLKAAPKVGPVKARRILANARCSPSKTLGGLTGRQRVELLIAFHRAHLYAAQRRAGVDHWQATYAA